MRHEEYNQMWKEWHDRKNGKAPPRKPLHTLKEIAEKLDISVESLRYKLKLPNAPKAILTKQQMGSATNKKYYDADAVIKWCKELNKDKK